MNEKVADWLLRDKHISTNPPENPIIKIIWKSTNDILFEGTEEECLSWEEAESWYVIEWSFNDNTFIVIVI